MFLILNRTSLPKSLHTFQDLFVTDRFISMQLTEAVTQLLFFLKESHSFYTSLDKNNILDW